MEAIQLFSDVINLEEALLKSEAEEKSIMWAERLSSERNRKQVDKVGREKGNKEEEVDEEEVNQEVPKTREEEKAAPLVEYETPPKTEAEAIFRLLDVNRQGFVTRKVILAR